MAARDERPHGGSGMTRFDGGSGAGGAPSRAPGRRRALGVLAALVLARPAAAHSELRRSSPAAGAVLDRPPAQIELHFNQRVMLTALRLRRADGEEVPLPRRPIREASSETIPLPPLPAGEWRAEWRIISADGHPVGGTIAFSIRP
jgi:methionine-rich copper-binding protein CopC